MQKHSFFPYVLETPQKDHHEATLGWDLSSLLLAGLVPLRSDAFNLDHTGNNISFLSALFLNRKAFAHAVSRWPASVALELQMTTVPDLEHQFRGKIHHSLLLRARGTTREETLALALRTFTSTQALLNSCFPEAEFSSICHRDRLVKTAFPFHPGHATLLTRQHRTINLAQPLLSRATGFTAPEAPQAQKKVAADYISQWLPNCDTQERLIHFLLWQPHPLWLRVRIQSGEGWERERQKLYESMEACNAYLEGGLSSKLVYAQQVRDLQRQLSRHVIALEEGGLRLAVLILSLQPADAALISLLGDSITQGPGGEKGEQVLEGGFTSRKMSLEKALDPWWFPEDEIYTPQEVAAAFRLPAPPSDELPGMPVKRFRSAFADVPRKLDEPADAIIVGFNAHRGVRQPVYCGIQDRMRHMYVLGMTGTGKSTFLENMIVQDLRNGHGLCLVDPHGELVASLLGKIPRKREKDVIVFNPLDAEAPVGFNLLQWQTIEERDQIIDDFYLTLEQMYDMRQAGGPMFENNFRNMLKLLMGDKPRGGFVPTILEFTALYLNTGFRKWLVATTEDADVISFVAQLNRVTGDGSIKNLAPYITSKMTRFVNDTRLKRIFGQEQTPFSFRGVLDEGKILFIDLAKGRFGSTVSALLASQIVSRFKTAAMSRADIPERERKPFFLYVDEFQNLPQDEFLELLAEARKYRLGLILANQFTSQLAPRSSSPQQGVLRALLGNVGTFVTFRLGVEDANLLGPLFHPTFSEKDLRELPNWQAYVSMKTGNKALPPFNVETILNTTESDAHAAMRVLDLSRKRYGRPLEEVDAAIRERRTFFESID